MPYRIVSYRICGADWRHLLNSVQLYSNKRREDMRDN